MKIHDPLKQAFRELDELKAAQARTYADLLTTKQKAADAAGYREEIKASADPEDIIAVRKLGEEAIRADLYARKISDLERQVGSLEEQCRSLFRPLMSEIRRFIAEDRKQHEAEHLAIQQAWHSGGAKGVQQVAPGLTRSVEPRYHSLDCDLMNIEEHLRSRSRKPFEVLEEISEAWEEFLTSVDEA